jgi:histone H3/H4
VRKLELPVAGVDRIIRKGSNMRVSEKAAKVLAEYLEEQGIKVAQQAANFARHANRKTITEADIRLAIKP